MQREEVCPDVLCGAGNEAENLREPTQHFHLRCAAALSALLAAAQALEQRQRTFLGSVHSKAAHSRHANDFAGAKGGDHGVTVLSAGLQGRKDRFDVVLHKEHVGEDNVASRDVFFAKGERFRVVVPVGRRVKGQLQAWELVCQLAAGTLDRTRDVAVQRYDNDANRRRVSGCSAPWHRTEPPK